jgi:hypothetical protein
MIAVVTTTPKYYTQNNTHCRLRTVIVSFKYDINIGINNLILDQAIDDNGNVLEILKERNSFYSFDEVNALFQYLDQPITLDNPFMDQLSTLIAHALLLETKNRPHRGTTADDWELYTEPVPVVEEPIMEEPVTEDPAPEEPVTEEPVTEDPAPEEPVTEEPVTEEPVTEDPAPEEPVTEDPAPEEPVTEDPAPEEPVAEEPTE